MSIDRDRLAWLFLAVVVVAVVVALGPPSVPPSVPPSAAGDALRYLAQLLDAAIARAVDAVRLTRELL